LFEEYRKNRISQSDLYLSHNFGSVPNVFIDFYQFKKQRQAKMEYLLNKD